MNESTLNVEIDEIDRKILRLLQENGRMTNAALAEAVGLTATPMLQRMRKLEQRGVITGYTALVDPKAVGRGTIAFVLVKQAEHRIESHKRVLAAVAKIPEVIECHHVAGEDDFLLKVVVRDIAEYERFLLDRLALIPGIDRVKTIFVLSTSKSGTALPIDEE
jgi:Lrp/AsnC family leucine-responsive transcriptional regulator